MKMVQTPAGRRRKHGGKVSRKEEQEEPIKRSPRKRSPRRLGPERPRASTRLGPDQVVAVRFYGCVEYQPAAVLHADEGCWWT